MTTDTTDDHAEDSETPSGPDPRLLEELDEHIRGARAAAAEALGEAGSEAHDDQAIAPG